MLRILATLMLALVIVPAAQAVPLPGTSGPFPGVLQEGQSDSHNYDNNPLDQPCLQVMRSYAVILEYAPPTDTLTLSAGGHTVTGANGFATITLTRSFCTSFGIGVGGADVEIAAGYVVNVIAGTVGGGS